MNITIALTRYYYIKTEGIFFLSIYIGIIKELAMMGKHRR